MFHEINVVLSVENVSLMFHMYLVMFHSSFHIHFQLKLSKLAKVEFNFIALPVGKIHVQCSFFC